MHIFQSQIAREKIRFIGTLNYQLELLWNVHLADFLRNFGILKKAVDFSKDNIPATTCNLACFILHNSCKMNGERVQDNLQNQTIQYEMEFQPHREQFTLPLNNYNERGGEKTQANFNIYHLAWLRWEFI